MALESLLEYSDNAREHGAANLAAVRESLTMFGQVEALVVRRATREVLGGNGRLAVMRELGWTHAAVHWVDLEPAPAKALSLALNRTAELAGWKQRLGEDLRQLAAAGIESSKLGWGPEQYEQLTGRFAAAAAEAMPRLNAATSSPLEQITFTLTHAQAAEVRRALDVARGQGLPKDTGNPNANGNAIAAVCAGYLGDHGDSA